MAPGHHESEPHRERQRGVVTKGDLRHIARAALTAIGLRLLIGLVKSIARFKLSSKLLWALRDEVLGTDPWKWAAVFSGWACFRPLFRTIEAVARPLLGDALGEEAVRQGATVAAGAIAAQPIRVMLMTTRTELALYLASRASHSVAATFILPRLPSPLCTFQHWDSFFVGLSAYQILYSLVFAPQAHSKAYVTFLNNCVLYPQQLWDTVAGFHRNSPVPAMLDYANAKGITPVPTSTQDMKTLCHIMHPHTSSCDLHTLQWIARHLRQFSVPLYLPLKVMTTLAFSHRKVLRDPLGQAWKIVKAVVQSSMFLTLYCGLPMRMVCIFNQLGLRSGWLIGAVIGGICTLPPLLEPKSRRLDLALYCNMHAFRALVLMLVQRAVIPPPKGRHVMMLYTAAVTVLMWFLRFRPADMHPNLRGALGFIVGDASK